MKSNLMMMASSSNRTFMELKYGRAACISHRKPLF